MADVTRLLIANRGEIACRIARTAHRLGIDTVGVYSEPDRNALHVDSVDVAVGLGGSSAAESYLRGAALIEAALSTGADAVHPGYGFLAENADFAQAVLDAGLIWVGPTPDQIRLLGDKVAAKKAAVEAGVPTTSVTPVAPGSIPDGITMPALVKAAAGGGGRGMRIVREAAALQGAVEAAAREAAAAFGDGSVFIEPYIEHGRHIEVQIFGDQHGNVVHLGERECSIQRRNQKVIEEAPSAGISDEVRLQLCDGAVALARAVAYEGAGTVEFLVGADDSITFLEVNTRLQVEHPVTEAVTGLDLVELQLRVAAGQPLPIQQAGVRVSGHAIEARIVAEDPAAGWLPSTGELVAFEFGDGVRVDTGFRAGAEVSAEYDSLLAKVISHASDRPAAARQLARALRRADVAGVQTNTASTAAVMNEPDYLAARTPTSYLDEHPEVLAPDGPAGEGLTPLLLGAVLAKERDDRGADAPTGFAPSGWRNLQTQGQRSTWLLDSGRVGDLDEHHVEYVMTGDASADVWLGRWPEPDADGVLSTDERQLTRVRVLRTGQDELTLDIDGRRHRVGVNRLGPTRYRTRSSTGASTWIVAPRFVEHEAEQAGGGPICPLPGTVVSVHVEPGQVVADGDLLVVVEAMKMEHRITASTDATVAEVHFEAGDRVDAGDLLVSLETPE